MPVSFSDQFVNISKRNEQEAMQAISQINNQIGQLEQIRYKQQVQQQEQQDAFDKQMQDKSEKERKEYLQRLEDTAKLYEKNPDAMQKVLEANPDLDATTPEGMAQLRIKVGELANTMEAAKTLEEDRNKLQQKIDREVIISNGKLVVFDDNGEPMDAYLYAGQETATKMTKQEINLRQQAKDIGIEWDENKGILENYEDIKTVKKNAEDLKKLESNSLVAKYKDNTKVIGEELFIEIPEEEALEGTNPSVMNRIFRTASGEIEIKDKKIRKKFQEENIRQIDGKYYKPAKYSFSIKENLTESQDRKLKDNLFKYHQLKDQAATPATDKEKTTGNQVLIIDGKEVPIERAKADFLKKKGNTEEKWEALLKRIMENSNGKE